MKTLFWVFLAGIFSVGIPGLHEAQCIKGPASTYLDINDSQVPVSTTTFYEFQLLYRNSNPLPDRYFSLWVDFDQGCREDDYSGIDTPHQTALIYNQDGLDDLENCGIPIPEIASSFRWASKF